jgi:hypothetical protein
MSGIPTEKWQQAVWIGAGLALFGILVALVWFVGSTVTDLVVVFGQQKDAQPVFILSGIALVTLTLIRILAIFLGGAIAFAGLAVSFFVHQQMTSLDTSVTHGDSEAAKVALATSSPGIVAVVIGAVIIIFALFAKTNYSSGGQSPSAKSVEQSNVPAREVPRPLDELPEPDNVPQPIQ